jgi:hypothetical protein
MSVTLMRSSMKKGTAKNSSNQNHGTPKTIKRPRRKNSSPNADEKVFKIFDLA